MTLTETHKMPILLIDDEEGIRNVLKITLESSGYQILAAADGEKGIAIFREQAPDIVITDIKMPGIDGIGVLEKIKELRPETEVIMITGHGDLDLAVKSLQNEAADFITKPIDINVLEAAIKKADERISISRRVKTYMDDLEDLIRKKDQKLNESEQLITVGQTIAGMSHAIKSIAGGLKGSSFILEQGIELGNPQYLKSGWEMVKGNIDKITKLSLDLLNYAKTARLSFQTVDPNDPAVQVTDLLSPMANEADIALSFSACSRETRAYMDPDAIHECLLNIVSNAIESLKTVPEKSGRKVSLAVQSNNDESILYQVRDNGPGVSDAAGKVLFKEFITTKGSSGTGFGLMTTQKIVHEHHGKIWFENHSSGGCSFFIELPLKDLSSNNGEA